MKLTANPTYSVHGAHHGSNTASTSALVRFLSTLLNSGISL